MAVFGINPGEGLAAAKQFAEQFGLKYPILVDDRNSVYNKYGQAGMTPFPLDYIIDQNGIVRYVNTEYRPQEMIAIIESLVEITDVFDSPVTETIPVTFSLEQNFPNPIKRKLLLANGTNIVFNLAVQENVKLEIYNLKGQKIRTLFSGELPGGTHNILWNGLDGSNNKVAGGVYLVILKNDRFNRTRKIIILP